MERVRRIAARWYSIPLILAVWQVSTMTGIVSPRLVPDLRLVAGIFWTDLMNGELIHHGGYSVMRALVGYGLAVVVGVALGLAMARSRLAQDFVEPIFLFGYPIPKIALFPVFAFVFGFGTPSKIAFVFLECLYPIAIATYFAFLQVQKTHIWAAQSMGASQMTVLRRVMIPAALPAIFSGLRIALPIAVVVVIITEMIGDTTGLGYYITYAAVSFKYPAVYAGIAAVAIVGFALDRLFALVRNRVIHWERQHLALY
jgi:NitT/TauT family transport system permease protein